MAQWQVIRITVHPRYYRAGIYKRIERSVLRQLEGCQNIDDALLEGWLNEVHPARGKNPSRRFAIYLTDSTYYHEVPITFSLVYNGKLLL